MSLNIDDDNNSKYDRKKVITGYFVGLQQRPASRTPLDTFDFEIKDLWDSEIGEYIVEDYKNIEK